MESREIFQEFEKKYFITLPIEIKCIYNLIDLNELALEYYDEVEQWNFRLTKWISYKNPDGRDEVLIDHFISNDDLVRKWDSHIQQWGNLEYLPIAFTTKPVNGMILLSLNAKTYGGIYIAPEGSLDVEFLTLNIFNFLYGLTSVLKDSDSEMQIKNLYKFKEEKFWRLKYTDGQNEGKI